jgi:hypothetical protein
MLVAFSIYYPQWEEVKYLQNGALFKSMNFYLYPYDETDAGTKIMHKQITHKNNA